MFPTLSVELGYGDVDVYEGQSLPQVFPKEWRCGCITYMRDANISLPLCVVTTSLLAGAIREILSRLPPASGGLPPAIA